MVAPCISGSVEDQKTSPPYYVAPCTLSIYSNLDKDCTGPPEPLINKPQLLYIDNIYIETKYTDLKGNVYFRYTINKPGIHTVRVEFPGDSEWDPASWNVEVEIYPAPTTVPSYKPFWAFALAPAIIGALTVLLSK